MKYDPSTPITEIGLSAPAVRALHSAGYQTLRDIASSSAAQLAKLHGFGPSGQKRLNQALEEAGLHASAPTKPTN